MPNLSGKVALITGSSSGIGKGVAIEFASLGASLTISGRNEETLNETKRLCLEKGLKESQIHVVIGDVSLEQYCRRLVQETVDKYGKLDIVVNSAGIINKGTVEQTNMSEYDDIMNINVRSVFLLCQLAIPHLKKSKGNIVNISSVTGLRAFPGIAAYCMTKAAIDQLTRVLALELAPDGVRANAVNPGVIITEIHKRGGMSDEEYAAFLEKCKATHALGRPGTVEEVAKSVSFLASEDSTFTTGVTLSVDGGRCQMCPR